MDVASLKTTSFWITLTVQVGLILGNLVDVVPAQWALYFAAGSFVSYTIGRTITKYRADFKRGFHTTEFWIGLVVVAQAALDAYNDSVPNTYTAGLVVAVAAVYKIARALQTARLVDVTSVTDTDVEKYLANNSTLKGEANG